jgi:hypothetical protein
MSATARRELENLPVAENAKEPAAVGNELESLELNSDDLVSCGDEVAKPGQDIPGSHVPEVCTSEIENATQPSLVHSSDVSYVECSLSGICEESPGTTDVAIVTEECSGSGVQKYDPSELEPHPGGTSDLNTSCILCDLNQEAQDSVETKKVKGYFIGAKHDRQGNVSGGVTPDSVSSLGTHSSQKKKIRASCSLVMNLRGTRKSKSVCDTSHVEQNSKCIKSYRTRSGERIEGTELNVVADMQEFNLENTTTSFTGLHLQCIDKTEPSPSRYSSPDNATSASFGMPVAGTALCDILDVPTSSGVQHEKRMYV